MALIRVADEWQYIDKEGLRGIRVGFDAGGDFHEGLAVAKRGHLWGYIEKAGEWAIGPQFEEAGDFSEGIAAVKQGGKWGYVDRNGKFTIGAVFDVAFPFREGLACVYSGKALGYIDGTGQMVVRPPPDNRVPDCFSSGISKIGHPVPKFGFRFGYLDKKGAVIVAPQFERAGSFNCGLAPVRQDGKWGFIDSTGSFVIKPEYEFAGEYREGLACVGWGGNYGYIDTKGRLIWQGPLAKTGRGTLCGIVSLIVVIFMTIVAFLVLTVRRMMFQRTAAGERVQ